MNGKRVNYPAIIEAMVFFANNAAEKTIGKLHLLRNQMTMDKELYENHR